MHGVRYVSRRPVAVLVLLTTSFKKKIGVAVSQQQIRRLALFSASRTTSIWSNALVSCSTPRKQGDTESLFCGPRFPRCPRKTQTRHWPQGHTASCAFFPLWHEGLRHGLGTSLLFHRCQSNLLSTGALLSNRTSVKVSFPRSPPDSTTTWVFRKFWLESL